MATILETATKSTIYAIEICEKAKLNQNIAFDIKRRIQCIYSPLIDLQINPLSRKQLEAISRLNTTILHLAEYLSEITTKKIIFRLYSASREPNELTHIFHSLTGILQDCEISLSFNISQNIRQTEILIENMQTELISILSKIQTIDDFEKEAIISEISTAIKCKPEDLKAIVREYMAYVGISKKVINERIDKLIGENHHREYFLRSSVAHEFWMRAFGDAVNVSWTDFYSAFISVFLNSLNLAQTYQNALLESIRAWVDPDLCGIVNKKACNNFFENIWDIPNNRANFISSNQTVHNPVQYASYLTLRVSSLHEANERIKKGQTFKISPQGYLYSKNLKYDGITTIGRKITQSPVDLCFPDSAISARHAQIAFHPKKGYSLVDLGSTGGTYIEVSKPLLLSVGLMVQLASSDIFVVKDLRLDFIPSALIPETFFKLRSQHSNIIIEESEQDITNLQLEESKNIEEVKNEEIKTMSIIEIEFVLKGQHKGQVFRFTKNQEITLGRLPENTIQLNDPYVSSIHCRIRFEERIGWVLEDNGSANKTWLSLSNYFPFQNKEPSPPVLLEDGMHIKIGNIDFQVSLSEN
ncbi:unnamed protein product [Blepharisma stoltei]|uniref:FHA domain-containing protein n=1 Tax=Blepharisma stoltei TaxID=1481888 RepID=A0AAU9IEQ1_9CILI|nr:unnamed protein product [Blepharisma stoltei]